MIDTFIVTELLMQWDLNNVHNLQLKKRLEIETSLIKQGKILDEIDLIVRTNIEIVEMLVLAYPEYISTKRLFKDIQR